jgi:hypothetical protein
VLAGCEAIDGAMTAGGDGAGGAGVPGEGAAGGVGSLGERGDDRVQAVIAHAIASRHAAIDARRERA